MAAEQVAQVATATVQLISAFIGVAGVVVGAALVWAKDWFTLRWNQKRQARYLAVRMVCILDNFVDGCVDVVQDKGEPMPNNTLDIRVKEPDFPKFPENLDWQSVDHNIAYRILSLPTSLKTANDITGFVFWKIAGPPDYEEGFETRQEQFAKLGLKVTSITHYLRRTYGIPENEERYCDPDRVFQEKLDEIAEREAKRRASHASRSKDIAAG